MSKYIDIDVLITDLQHDVANDVDILNCTDISKDNKEIVQFDKDCKQNAIDLLLRQPTVNIIYCKECKYAHMTHDGLCKYCDIWKDNDDNYIEVYHDGKHFCSYGQRSK